MNDLAEVIFAIVSNPHLLNDFAALKAFLVKSGLSSEEIRALITVLQNFDWSQQSLSEMLNSFSFNAQAWDPAHQWGALE